MKLKPRNLLALKPLLSILARVVAHMAIKVYYMLFFLKSINKVSV